MAILKGAFILAATGFTAAQYSDGDGQPKCALKCLQDGVPTAGCELDDTACQCDSNFRNRLLGDIINCITAVCSTEEVLSVVGIADSACEDFNKTNVVSTAGVSTASGETDSSYATSWSYIIGDNGGSYQDSTSSVSDIPITLESDKSPTSTTETSSTPWSTVDIPVYEKTKSNLAWIVGPVVGGLVFLLLLPAIWYFIMKRRDKKAKTQGVHKVRNSQKGNAIHEMEVSNPQPHELEGFKSKPYEMEGSIPQPSEMTISELPAIERNI